MSFDNVTLNGNEDFLDVLPKYQRNSLNAILRNNNNNYEAAGALWLKSASENISQFGGQPTAKQVLFDEVVQEVEFFLCGNEKYEKLRKDFEKIFTTGNTLIVSTITLAIQPVFGIASSILTVLVALVLKSIGTFTVNGWCSMRKKTRDSSTHSNN